ncbi:7-methylguanosine phosphate-specific 5'-nucleotidase [Diachasmimorpha longicaudata]|uniref:7-methylguanosine phosphate-specific 5'-nucleotidase n=1 Tax=Diachasmimorpha longicaudata TaxID=58733 RepID=UPI0030B8ECB6
MPETACEDLTTLKRSHVFMRDPDNVKRIIGKIRRDGPDKLQIISDFDQTITKQHVDGKCLRSSFGIFYKCKQIPSETKAMSTSLYHKYQPMEVDPHLDEKAKIKAMEDWMIETQNLLKNIEFDTAELDDVVQIHGSSLRDGTRQLLERLQAANVPVLVFSAGLGDVVEQVLRHHNVYLDNVKIISNFLKFRDSKLDGFKNDVLIHVFNKNEKAVDTEYFGVLEGRNNVILMGDITGDATMADGVNDCQAILKIGFLYGNVEQRLPSHMEAFDIVLVDDQTMDVVNEILNEMF